jgi:hypothetical protein
LCGLFRHFLFTAKSRESTGARRIRRIVITVNHSFKYFSNSGSFESYRRKHKPDKTFDGYCRWGKHLIGRLKGGGCSTNTERGGSMASSGRSSSSRGTCKGRVSMRRRGGRLQELPQGRRGEAAGSSSGEGQVQGGLTLIEKRRAGGDRGGVE